jgi:hypothetical protein
MTYVELDPPEVAWDSEGWLTLANDVNYRLGCVVCKQGFRRDGPPPLCFIGTQLLYHDTPECRFTPHIWDDGEVDL